MKLVIFFFFFVYFIVWQILFIYFYFTNLFSDFYFVEENAGNLFKMLGTCLHYMSLDSEGGTSAYGVLVQREVLGALFEVFRLHEDRC